MQQSGDQDASHLSHLGHCSRIFEEQRFLVHARQALVRLRLEALLRGGAPTVLSSCDHGLGCDEPVDNIHARPPRITTSSSGTSKSCGFNVDMLSLGRVG